MLALRLIQKIHPGSPSIVFPAKERARELKDGWIGAVRPPPSRGQALRDGCFAASLYLSLIAAPG
jgi:hypothetical protein